VLQKSLVGKVPLQLLGVGAYFGWSSIRIGEGWGCRRKRQRTIVREANQSHHAFDSPMPGERRSANGPAR
jgi:hypothetical protein